jgi:hypothetical protein
LVSRAASPMSTVERSAAGRISAAAMTPTTAIAALIRKMCPVASP